MEYRQKPIVVKAMQMEGNPPDIMDVVHWVEDTCGKENVSINPGTGLLEISVNDGRIIQIEFGEWIVFWEGANFSVYPDSVFQRCFEVAHGKPWSEIQAGLDQATNKADADLAEAIAQS